MKLVLFCLFLGAHFYMLKSEVCLTSWKSYPGCSSSGAMAVASVSSLQDCLLECKRQNNCLAVDYDTAGKNGERCWLHDSPDFLSATKFFNSSDPTLTQYRISRNCSKLTEACPPDWDRLTVASTADGSSSDYWIEYDCFTYCRYQPDCIAASFDAGSSPPCKVHTKAYALAPNTSTGIPQYRFNKTCRPPTTDSHQIGRCVGQAFTSPSLCVCAPGQTANITSAMFEFNPICCWSSAGDTYPPESTHFSRLWTSYVDPSYFDDIKFACENKSTIMAKSYIDDKFFPNNYCPDKIPGSTYVSINYGCFGTAETPSTQIKTDGRSLTTQHLIPPASEAVRPATEQTLKYSDRLTIGLVVGLGVPLILICIIVVLVVIRKRRRSKEKKITESKPPANAFYYGAGTMPRKEMCENQINEVSVVNDESPAPF